MTPPPTPTPPPVGAVRPYTVIVGLEVHVQLATHTKLFCRCPVKFGAPPNTQTCPVCIGLPGALPVLNETAYYLSVVTALALNCEIPAYTKWDRKNYYYPDLPKGYQISQFDLPMSCNGWLDLSDAQGRCSNRRIRIIRAHLEEDAGKSMHDEIAGRADTRIDLNRTGTPLLEIVSQPDLRSSAEAKAYLTELKLLLTYLGVSDCNMQEGSLRVDANVNLHIPVGSGTPEEIIETPIVEIKNMNSFRAVERALDFEVDRQYREWQATGKQKGEMPKQTRGWDDIHEVTKPQRSKEESSDYRYFPDPDLVPVTTTTDQLEAIRSTLKELPAALRLRLITDYGVTPYDADVIVNQGRTLADYFLAVADQCGDGKQACNWVTQEVLRSMKEGNLTIESFPIPSLELGRLIQSVQAGKLPRSRAKEVFGVMLEQILDLDTTLSRLGIQAVDSGALTDLGRELLAANPKVVADVQAGKEQAIGALVGQAKKSNPNVDPGVMRQILLDLIRQSAG
ncbi:MAG: Asp-tRNA(Asn)/Glu-tRNA(Gln) amidotransferase subunit GatB [Planctomycetota bacterium]|nr:Asp-tRNA(Asn)/Glu-tRNA(Gln) amidotransferase subunit GatB [Planctomycetota bacterium]